MFKLPPYFIDSEPSNVRAMARPYHLIDLGILDWHAKGILGAGIKTGICDTGIDASHPEFEDRIVASESFVYRGRRKQAVDDGNGHGTHVAGSVAGRLMGILPQSELVIAKALSNGGSSSGSSVSDSIDYCREQGVNSINLSLGGSSEDPRTTAAIERAIAANILVFAASGNERANVVGWPAQSCIGIGAVDRNFLLADFSNRGKKVDLVTPGVGIESSVPDGQYQKLSGTSMASPIACALFGLLQSAELLKYGKIKTVNPTEALKIESHVIDLGPEGRDVAYGRGLPDVAAALAFFDEDVVIPPGGECYFPNPFKMEMTLELSPETIEQLNQLYGPKSITLPRGPNR